MFVKPECATPPDANGLGPCGGHMSCLQLGKPYSIYDASGNLLCRCYCCDYDYPEFANRVENRNLYIMQGYHNKE